jgi:hypothetical protein
MHDGISFDKNPTKTSGFNILGQELQLKTVLENRKFCHNIRSATSWFTCSLAGSSLFVETLFQEFHARLSGQDCARF